MPALATPDRPMVKTPEKPEAPKTVEKPKAPLGENETRIATEIAQERAKPQPDPDRVLADIAKGKDVQKTTNEQTLRPDRTISEDTEKDASFRQKVEQTVKAVRDLLTLRKTSELLHYVKNNPKVAGALAVGGLSLLSGGVGLDAEVADVIAKVSATVGGGLGFSDYNLVSNKMRALLGDSLNGDPSVIKNILGVTAKAGDYAVGAAATLALSIGSQQIGSSPGLVATMGMIDDVIPPAVSQATRLLVRKK